VAPVNASSILALHSIIMYIYNFKCSGCNRNKKLKLKKKYTQPCYLWRCQHCDCEIMLIFDTFICLICPDRFSFDARNLGKPWCSEMVKICVT
jgi:hypothetical protein